MILMRCLWLLLASAWIVGELRLARRSRIAGNLMPLAQSFDERYLWLVVLAGVGFALFLKQIHSFMLPLTYLQAQLVGIMVFLSGLSIRVWAVCELAVFFSTQLRVEQEHVLISSGPYHYVRHPSYSGMLLALCGAGIAMGNGLALLALLAPTVWMLYRRIQLEERMLLTKLGTDYADYQQQTYRLIPWIY